MSDIFDNPKYNFNRKYTFLSTDFTATLAWVKLLKFRPPKIRNPLKDSFLGHIYHISKMLQIATNQRFVGFLDLKIAKMHDLWNIIDQIYI